MVSVLASSAEDCEFESRSGQTKYYKMGICITSRIKRILSLNIFY